MKIEPYIHYCTVRSGDLAGNKVRTEVTSWDVEFEKHCDHCGELLATPEQIIAHIYDELTEGLQK